MPIGDLVDRWDFRDRDLAVVLIAQADESRFFEALKHKMQTVHDCITYGVGGGTETVGIPFGHVVLTGRDTLSAEQGRLHRMLAEAFGDYVDPLTGLRVAYYEPTIPWNAWAAFFGRGVFVPEPAETPVGEVTIRPCDGNGRLTGEATPVRLPTRRGTGRAAGFYRGQAGLAFAHPETRRAPATHPAVPNDPVVFYLAPRAGDHENELKCIDRPFAGEGGEDDARKGRKRAFSGLFSRRATGDDAGGGKRGIASSYAIQPLPQADPASPHVEIDVRKDQKPVFRLSYVLDARASALRAASRAEIHLRIIGLVGPGEAFVSRWWIDLDAAGRLVSSAALAPARSIICQDGAVATYNWAANPPGFERQSDWDLVSSRFAPWEAALLKPKPGRPSLGVLERPRRTCPALFGRPSGGEAYELDWLDFAGAVQKPGARPVRLGEWWAATDHRKGRSAMMPGENTSSDEARMVRVRRQPGGRFAPWDGRWETGLEFQVGPLLLVAAKRDAGS